MALYGDLSDISLADVLYLIKLRHVSGRLSLQTEHDDAMLWFVDGNLVHVAASASAHHLGQWLVRRGILTWEQLGEALARQASTRTRQPLGGILTQLGWLSTEQLAQALTDQAEDILYGILTWPGASFNFVTVEAPPPGLPLRELNLDRIILEATRRLDEQALIRSQIPSLECTVSLVKDQQMISLDTTERGGRQARHVLSGIMHFQPRQPAAGSGGPYRVTLRQLMRITNMPETELLGTVYSLAQRGVLRIEIPASVAVGATG